MWNLRYGSAEDELKRSATAAKPRTWQGGYAEHPGYVLCTPDVLERLPNVADFDFLQMIASV